MELHMYGLNESVLSGRQSDFLALFALYFVYQDSRVNLSNKIVGSVLATT